MCLSILIILYAQTSSTCQEFNADNFITCRAYVLVYMMCPANRIEKTSSGKDIYIFYGFVWSKNYTIVIDLYKTLATSCGTPLACFVGYWSATWSMVIPTLEYLNIHFKWFQAKHNIKLPESG